MKIEVDRDKTARMGLTLAEVGLAVRTAIEGDISTKYQEGDTEFDTRVVLNKESRSRAEDVGEITLLNHFGQPVQLSQVAAIYYGKGPSQIQRKDRETTGHRRREPDGTGPSGAGDAAAEKMINAAGIPPGIRVFYGGDAENMRDMFSDMTIALSLAVLFVYIIMVSLFESYIHPFTIMFSLPLALVGALGGLALAGTTLSMFSMIGIIMLMGLVTKNAILLVDFTNTLRARGLAMHEALAASREDPPAPDHHDDGHDGLRHDAARAGARGGLRNAARHGDRRGLRADQLNAADARPYSGDLYLCRWPACKRPGLFKRVAWAARIPWKGRPASVREEGAGA